MSETAQQERFTVFNQRPGATVEAQSPLHHRYERDAATHGAGDAGVTLGEVRFLGHLSLRGNPDDEAFRSGCTRALGLELPTTPLTISRTEAISIQWISPDEWLVLVPGGNEHTAELDLRRHLDGHYSVVNVSGGQTLITLRGPHARDVLMKSAPYDLHPRNFPVDKGVLTVFAKASANIRRAGEDEWELIVRRTFADYIWGWLCDAATEYGLALQAP